MCNVSEFLEQVEQSMSEAFGGKVALHLGRHVTSNGHKAPLIYATLPDGQDMPLFIGVTPDMMPVPASEEEFNTLADRKVRRSQPIGFVQTDGPKTIN